WVGAVGPNGVRPRASAAGPYKFCCGHKPRCAISGGRIGNGLTVCFRFCHRLFVFQQGVILSRDWPRGLDARVFPNRRCPIVQFHRASVLLVLQPPFGFLAQPPLESVNKFGGVGNGAGAPLVADFPLFVPAALANGLLDAPNVLVVADCGEAGFPQRPAFGWPACRDQRNSLGVVAFHLLPEAEWALPLIEWHAVLHVILSEAKNLALALLRIRAGFFASLRMTWYRGMVRGQ